MAIPTLLPPEPASGPTSGGDLVTLRGSGFASKVAVRFGSADAAVESVRQEGPQSIAVIRTPAHAEASVDIALQNLDAAGVLVPGELAVLSAAYRYLRARIVREADLTRLIRTLLRELKRQVIENVSLSVAVDFDDTPLDGLDVVAISKLPSLVLSGPRLRENRTLSTNELLEEAVVGPSGPELRRRRPPLTIDLEFGITGASDRAVELLNLIGATSTFLNTNRWLAMLRDPDAPDKGSVRWEMDPLGELHVNLEGKDDVRAFTWGLVIHGFDIDEGQLLDLGKAVSDAGAEVNVGAHGVTP